MKYTSKIASVEVKSSDDLRWDFSESNINSRKEV
jgi:hypothetical protein